MQSTKLNIFPNGRKVSNHYKSDGGWTISVVHWLSGRSKPNNQNDWTHDGDQAEKNCTSGMSGVM
jgi:hypothetical protein